jgi:hypothetical protein
MPLTLRQNGPNYPFYVIAKNAAGLGAPLPGGASLQVGADPAGIGVVSLDPNPVRIQNPRDPASGTASVASGVVSPVAVGETTVKVQLFTPGTAIAALEIEDTVTVVAPADGVPEWAGDLFGTGLPLDVTLAPEPGQTTPERSHRRNRE